MRRYAVVFGIVPAILTILGAAAFSLFEVYPRPRYSPPSEEALANEYLALERWLEKTGHPVRVAGPGGPALIKEAAETTVIIQASCFDWSEGGLYEPGWFKGGGALIISLDVSWEEVFGSLRPLGVESGDKDFSGTGAYPEPGGEFPAFDPRISFSPKEGAETMADADGIIRLVTVPLGEGSVTVLGIPYFMWSSALGEPQNARLAWELTGARDRENRGVLFIRSRPDTGEAGSREREPGFFEKIARRGHIIPLALSLLVLIAVRSWMLIPGFGRPVKDEGGSAKPIEERFLAEARFLKKYHALGGYLDVYIREIIARLRRREGRIPEAPDRPGEEEGLVPRILRACDQTGLDPRMVERAIRHGPRVSRRDFVKYRIIMETILERL
jgi:hypothetical protein